MGIFQGTFKSKTRENCFRKLFLINGNCIENESLQSLNAASIFCKIKATQKILFRNISTPLRYFTTKQNFNKITIIVIKLLYINLNLNNFTNQNFSIFLNEIIKKREEKIFHVSKISIRLFVKSDFTTNVCKKKKKNSSNRKFVSKNREPGTMNAQISFESQMKCTQRNSGGRPHCSTSLGNSICGYIQFLRTRGMVYC